MAERNSEVTIDSGTVAGVVDGDTISWRGIPYAAPPVGDLRWRAPQRPQSWDGVRAGSSFRYAAPQPRRLAAVGINKYQPVSEDCLTLNVMAPAEPSSTPRPVMFFIHGGAFILGTSAFPLYHGDSLVNKGDIVYVSINYRLGPLGFVNLAALSDGAHTFDDNCGIRDQVAALEWVQRNIAQFGGDPDNVTIFGESAGATSVTTLLAVPSAQGLFHQAIAQSSAPGLVNPASEAQQWGVEFANALSPDGDRIAALYSATPGELGRLSLKIARRVSGRSPTRVIFGPQSGTQFLPADPAVALARGDGNRVPLIIGTNKTEANLFKYIRLLPTNDRGVRTLLGVSGADTAEKIMATYGKTARDYVQTIGDWMFWAPTVRLAQAHAAHAPTYFYRYDFAPTPMRLAGYGATHMTEMFAVFGMFDQPKWRVLALGDRDQARRVTNLVQGHWLSFAHSGKPDSELNPPWPEYDESRRETMIFADHTRVVEDPERGRREAWADFEVPVAP